MMHFKEILKVSYECIHKQISDKEKVEMKYFVMKKSRG